MNTLVKEIKKLLPVASSLRTPIWVKNDYTRIPVRNMSTLHINNCIACLEGRGNMKIREGYLGGKEKWLKIFNEELARRN